MSQAPSQSSASTSNKYIPSPKNKSIVPKLFKWNREKPRVNSEYLDGNFRESFNKIAPELLQIGGLGQVKCIEKQEQRHRPVNRPTRVQKVSHTTTKLLPNFSLTAKLNPVACRQEKQPKNVFEHAERVKFADNLPPSLSSSSTVLTNNSKGEKTNKKKIFNHQNPFNLDLGGLSEYQRQKSAAKEVERRRNYQIIRRTMETKKLKTEGREKIKQQERDEKFQLPELFKICDANSKSSLVSKIITDSSSSISDNERCKVVAVMEKPEIRDEAKRHYERKMDKLRQQVRKENLMRKTVEEEEMKKLEEEEENLIFHLADESLPCSSECTDIEHTLQMKLKAFPPSINRLDYPSNESELLELKRKLQAGETLDEIKREKLVGKFDTDERGLSCGQKDGNRVILRGFHDRLYSEPRGKINLHIKVAAESTCLTHTEWLHEISNDPKITSEPPKVKLISCLKPSREPNDDKTMLFEHRNDCSKKIDFASIESPIKQHIRQINENLRLRYRNEKRIKIKKSKNEIEKQVKRMSFMGIPTTSDADASQCAIKSIVEKISLNGKSTSKERLITTKSMIKFIPKMPSFQVEEEEDESKQTKATSRFEKAQPRGNDPKMLRVDKSLPWIQSEIDEIKRKKLEKSENLWKFPSQVEIAKSQKVVKNEAAESQSAIKKAFNEIIESKLQNQKSDLNLIEDSEMREVKSIESTTTLSSTGTYFSNDNGSYFMILGDRKIPKSELNIANKFQNFSLVTTQEQPPYDSIPYIEADLNEVKHLLKAPDRFHTHRTRSCANIRDRVKIESPAYENEVIGDEGNKFPSKLATDVDDAYIKEFYNHRSRTQYRFLRKTEMEKLRETLRKKMDIYWMQENELFHQVNAENEAKIMNEIKKEIETYNKFLDSHKESTHRKSMKIVEQVKNYYQATDKLRIQHESLFSQIEPLKMKIFYIANEYVHRVMYEDVQFLLMPTEWREKNDFLHRTSEGKLENFRQSIEQRGKRNVWNRDNFSVETIMNFINATFTMDKSTQKQKLFNSGNDFLNALKILQSKSFKMLEKFTYAAMTLKKCEIEKEQLEMKGKNFGIFYDESTSHLLKRRSFMQARVDEIQLKVKSLMKKPLEESFGAPLLRDVTALCNHLFQDKLAGDESAKYFTSIEKFALIERKVLDLFMKLDEIPRDLIDEIDKRVRAMRQKKMRVALRAYKNELNIEHTMTQIERLLAKPKRKERHEGKLPRSVLPKAPPKPQKIVPLLSPLEEKYAKAFMELNSHGGELKFDENVKSMIQKIKNESVPFYLDYYLEKRGIKIGKLNELQSEEILKDEEALLKHKDVLANVRKQVKIWEEIEAEKKEENIRRTAYLYE